MYPSIRHSLDSAHVRAIVLCLGVAGCATPAILQPTIVGGAARDNETLKIEAKVLSGVEVYNPTLTLTPKSPPPAPLTGTIDSWGPYPPPAYQGDRKFAASVTSTDLKYPTVWTAVVSTRWNAGVFRGGSRTLSASIQDFRVQPPAACNPLDEGARLPRAFIGKWIASPFVTNPQQQELKEVETIPVALVMDRNYPTAFAGGAAVKIGPLPRQLANEERVAVLFVRGPQGIPHSNGGFSMHAQALGTIRPVGAYQQVASGVTYHVHGSGSAGTPDAMVPTWNTYVLSPNFQPVSTTQGWELGWVGFDLIPSGREASYVDLPCGL